MGERMNKVIIVVGNRGTGKTDFEKKLMKGAPFDKKLIVDTFDSPAWRNMKTHDAPGDAGIPVPQIRPHELPAWSNGIYRMWSSDVDQLMFEVERHCMDTFIVFEDAAKYIEQKLPKPTVRFLLDSKQKNLDLVFVFHSLAEVPPGLVRKADWLVLFKTNESWTQTHKNKYPGSAVKAAFDKVQASTNPHERAEIIISG